MLPQTPGGGGGGVFVPSLHQASKKCVFVCYFFFRFGEGSSAKRFRGGGEEGGAM